MTEDFDIVGFLESGAKTESDFRKSKLFVDPNTGKFIFPKKYIALLIQYKQIEVVPAYKDDQNVYHKKLYRVSSDPNAFPDNEETKIESEIEDENSVTDEILEDAELQDITEKSMTSSNKDITRLMKDLDITIVDSVANLPKDFEHLSKNAADENDEKDKTQLISHSKTMLTKPEIPPQEEPKYIGIDVTAFNLNLDHKASDNKKVEKTELEKDQEFYDRHIKINPEIRKNSASVMSDISHIDKDKIIIDEHGINPKLLGLTSDLSTPDPSQQKSDAFFSKATIVDGGFVAMPVEVKKEILESSSKIETKTSISVDTPVMSPKLVADAVNTIKSFEMSKSEDPKKVIRDQIVQLETELKSAGMFKRGGIKKQIEELKAQL